MNKEELLKIASDVREQGITTNITRELVKKAAAVRIVSLLAFINK